MNLATAPARRGQASDADAAGALRVQLRNAEAELVSLEGRTRDLLALADEKARAAARTEHLKTKNTYRRASRRFVVLANFPAKRMRELAKAIEVLRAQLEQLREEVAA